MYVLHCKNYFCGISLYDASQCNDNDVCPSGSDSDSGCGLGHYAIELNFLKLIFCGI